MPMIARSPFSVPEGLPPLIPEESARVAEVVALLRQHIAAAGGTISFAEYMETALYAPNLGYYTGGLHKFGASGDFVTAPEISPLFGRCLARQVGEVLAQLGGGEVLEVGAGSGVLAAELLATLETMDCAPRRYRILERSSELCARQAETLAARLPHWRDRIEWCADLPEPGWVGVVVANELLDALPVYRFEQTEHGVMEHRVGWREDRFEWCVLPAEGYLASALEDWQARYGADLGVGYLSELSLAATAWLATLAERMTQGSILLIDYGYPSREYYHPDRRTGTLACHYRHRFHDDPFILPGLQDITAHVNFTAIAEAAATVGLAVSGYTTQAYFLIATGIMDAFSSVDTADTRAQLSLANQVRRLTLPNEMGEMFKVIAVSRGLSEELCGFQYRDLRGQL